MKHLSRDVLHLVDELPPAARPSPTSSPWGRAVAWVTRGDTQCRLPKGNQHTCRDRPLLPSTWR